VSDKAKYERMASIIDGPLTQTIMEFTTSPDDFNDLRRRLSAMLIAVNKLGNVPSAVCLLCSVIQNKKICHKSGCPSCFNHCFKCLGRHSSQSCSNKYFNVSSVGCLYLTFLAFLFTQRKFAIYKIAPVLAEISSNLWQPAFFTDNRFYSYHAHVQTWCSTKRGCFLLLVHRYPDQGRYQGYYYF
jgi:hypothetical protein